MKEVAIKMDLRVGNEPGSKEVVAFQEKTAGKQYRSG